MGYALTTGARLKENLRFTMVDIKNSYIAPRRDPNRMFAAKRGYKSTTAGGRARLQRRRNGMPRAMLL
jgi:hypothetical protein